MPQLTQQQAAQEAKDQAAYKGLFGATSNAEGASSTESADSTDGTDSAQQVWRSTEGWGRPSTRRLYCHVRWSPP